MTIRITDDFTLRRVAGQLIASIGPIAVKLSASQARDAAEAFGIMACMVGASEAEDASDGEDASEEETKLLEVAA